MRYFINFDKTINQLTPAYMGGRKLILFMQSLLYPLRSINDAFVEWAKETRIEASMTSQILPFEWFLNRKFSKYFLNPAGRITISNASTLGVAFHNQSADIPKTDNALLYQESEDSGSPKKSEKMYWENEKTDDNSYSFLVHTPAVDETLIKTEAYIAMLSHYIDRYRLSGKTYKIIFNV